MARVCIVRSRLEMSDHGALQGFWGTLTHFFLTLVTEGLPSGSSHCEWAGIKQQIHLNIPVSLSLCIPFSPLNHRGFRIFSRQAILWFLCQPSKQILEHFLTHQASPLNAESLLSEPTSIDLVWHNLVFLPSWSHIFGIHSYTCSPDFCLRKLLT